MICKKKILSVNKNNRDKSTAVVMIMLIYEAQTINGNQSIVLIYHNGLTTPKFQ